MSLRERKKAETLRAILDAADRLFREQGYGATRTRDIAAAAGIATGTLFNYAPTKEAVVVLLWQDHARRAVAAGAEAASTCDDPVDALVATFAPLFDLYAADRELGRVFLQQVMFDASETAEMRDLNEGFLAALTARLVPVAGAAALPAALNAFAAYYTVLTMLLAGRLPHVASAVALHRTLVRAQADGWAPPPPSR